MVLPIWLDENGQRVPPILEEAALLGFVKKTDYSCQKELRESALPPFHAMRHNFLLCLSRTHVALMLACALLSVNALRAVRSFRQARESMKGRAAQANSASFARSQSRRVKSNTKSSGQP